MYFSSNGISIFIKKNFRKVKPEKKTIVFLHGFGGSSSDWEEVFNQLGSEFQLLAIDLPGFGKSSKPRSDIFYNVDFLIQLVDDILNDLKLSDIILAGYSMGGRLALQYTLANQQKVRSLILESSSPGIKTLQQQQARQKSDSELISFIKNNSLNDFFSFWQNQSLFNSQKNLPLKIRHTLYLRKTRENSRIGLANSLKNFGQGVVESCWHKLVKIKIPVLLLSGALDTKYTIIQKEMDELLPNAKHKIIENAGHNLHLEKPEVFVNLIKEFLQFQN